MTASAITSEIQKLAPSSVIELFVLDLALFGQGPVRFHAGTNALQQRVVWQGSAYEAFPIEVEGFEFNGNGQVPRPRLRVANVTGAITALVLTYQDLVGAKITRKRTLAKYLDAVNFEGSVNPTVDPSAEFADDVYYVDRKSRETRDVVEFELAHRAGDVREPHGEGAAEPAALLGFAEGHDFGAIDGAEEGLNRGGGVGAAAVTGTMKRDLGIVTTGPRGDAEAVDDEVGQFPRAVAEGVDASKIGFLFEL